MQTLLRVIPVVLLVFIGNTLSY
ncbi:MAG: hypothetical protein FD167_2363, partial [bacterium]